MTLISQRLLDEIATTAKTPEEAMMLIQRLEQHLAGIAAWADANPVPRIPPRARPRAQSWREALDMPPGPGGHPAPGNWYGRCEDCECRRPRAYARNVDPGRLVCADCNETYRATSVPPSAASSLDFSVGVQTAA